MSAGLLIGVGVAVLLVIIVVVAVAVSMSGSPAQNAPPPAGGSNVVTGGNVAQRVYSFFQGADSGGNDIRQDAANANNLAGLKADCDGTPGCVGFNTNGWLKSKINPRANWSTWTSDAGKGLYVLDGTSY